MSAKRKPSAGAAPDAMSVLLAMLRTNDGVDDFRGNLAAALQQLPAFLENEDGFNDCAVQEFAEKILNESMEQPFWLEARALHERLQNTAGPTSLSNEDVSTLGRYTYLTAGGAFALGVAAGLRLGAK